MNKAEIMIPSTEIAEFRPFAAQMQEFRERYDGVVYDLEDPPQEKQARSDRLAIGKVISKLDKTHAAIKAPLLEKVRVIDGERKRIKDDLLGIQGKIKSQIAAHEAKIQARAEALQAEIDRIVALTEFDGEPGSVLIRERLEAAKAIDPESEVYGVRQADAALAVRQTVSMLDVMLAKRIVFEKEQAELARLRAEKEERERKERDERIRKEAAERAKREAEDRAKALIEEAQRREERAKAAKAQAEAAAKAAEERRERERQEAEERHAKAIAEAAQRARLEEQRKQAEERARADAERAEAERKAADSKHRARIEQEVVVDLNDCESPCHSCGDQIMDLIKAGKVRHVTINY